MPRLKFPDLPSGGALYELKVLLHDLHGLAGTPSLRVMAKQVSCSHDKIHKLFTSDECPADGDVLFRLAGWLATQGPRPRFVEDAEDDRREQTFYDELDKKWRAAQRYASLPPLPASPEVAVRRPRPREESAPRDAASTRAGQEPKPPADGGVTVLRNSAEVEDFGGGYGIFPEPARSRGVVVAVDSFASPVLANLQGVRQGAMRLAEVLTDPGREGSIPDTEIQINPETPLQVLEAIERGSEARDTFLLYFAGHALVTPQGKLTIPTHGSDPESRFSNMAWDDARSLIAEASAARSIVILDTCYSGTAGRQPMGTADGAFRLQVAEQMTAMLTSTGAHDFAFVNDNGPLFTSALIDLLTNGDPNLDGILTIDEIYRGLCNWARRENVPIPQHFSIGHRHLALGRNPAHPPARRSPEPTPSPNQAGTA